MAIQTSIAPRQKWWNLLYLVLCLGLGLWGLYDYLVTIPAEEATYESFVTDRTRFDELVARRDAEGLTAAESTELAEVDARLLEFVEAPSPPAKWDRPVNLWLYVVGCGVIGVPYFAWVLFNMSRKHYRLDDDGTLHLPNAVWKADEITGIDMDKWMAKSTAWVLRGEGERALLDDYKYRNMHLIVGAIAHRFDPGTWTEEAKLIKKAEPDSDDGSDVDSDVEGAAPTADSSA